MVDLSLRLLAMDGLKRLKLVACKVTAQNMTHFCLMWLEDASSQDSGTGLMMDYTQLRIL